MSTGMNAQWEPAPATTAELVRMSERLGVAIEASQDVSCLAAPVIVGGRTIPNSLATHPMEGCDSLADGQPGPLTIRRYERFAGGGSGLIWVEAIAVAPEGRANPRQLWLHEGSAGGLARLVERIGVCAARVRPGHRPYLVAQLTHSGRHSRPRAFLVHVWQPIHNDLYA